MLRNHCPFSPEYTAKARDDHYHNPPDYLVLEPEDTSTRTINLQQTNTNGYKFQGSKEEFSVAENHVNEWGPTAKEYSPDPSYQMQTRELIEKYKYRLDTNYAKMDRIVHKEIEEFKTIVLNKKLYGLSIKKWSTLLAKGTVDEIETVFKEKFRIKE